MGKNTVKFRCHSCGHCCTEVVCMPTPWDVIRIVRETGANPYAFLEFLTPEEVEGVDEDDATWLEAGKERYIMSLRRDEREGCFFLNKTSGYCSIYESRPILCRLFPFALQETKEGVYKGFGLHDDVGCPRNTDGVVDCDQLYELYLEDCEHHTDYETLVEVFNKREYKGKKPEDFIEMFIKVKGRPKAVEQYVRKAATANATVD